MSYISSHLQKNKFITYLLAKTVWTFSGCFFHWFLIFLNWNIVLTLFTNLTHYCSYPLPPTDALKQLLMRRLWALYLFGDNFLQPLQLHLQPEWWWLYRLGTTMKVGVKKLSHKKEIVWLRSTFISFTYL